MYNKRKLETWLAIFAIIAIVIAWFIGGQLENADTVSSIREKFPEIGKLVEINNSIYKTYSSEGKNLGYVALESSMGYGGPLQMAVVVNDSGTIVNLAIINSKETPSYLEKVLNDGFLEKITGKNYSNDYILGREVDAISSATYSSRAILEASIIGCRSIASKELGFEVPKGESPAIKFGALEAILIILFIIGYFAHKGTFKYKKQVRWITMIVGLFVIGFFNNQLFSLSMVNQLLLGYFPPIHSHLYWYLLLGGIFLVLTIDNKNPYCHRFCPFGAAQECMGLVGGAKHISIGKFRNVFKWTLRVMVLFAIIIALLLRNPGVTSFEVFGTLFKLTGSNIQFAILGIVLVSSIFIKRPWCNYICPAGPVFDHFTFTRNLIVNKWKKRKINLSSKQ